MMTPQDFYQERIAQLERELSAANEAIRTQTEGNARLVTRVVDAERERDELAAALKELDQVVRDIIFVTDSDSAARIGYDALRNAEPSGYREILAAHDAAKDAEIAGLVEAITEYRYWYDTCTKRLAPYWERRAALASERLDAALAPYRVAPDCAGKEEVGA